ncbi:hypothetical protein V2J09_004559 [Rumex salicifolius]
MSTYLINRFPSKTLKGLTPFECLYKKPPSYTHIKPFGCLCFSSTSPRGRDKFAPRAESCVFLGFPFGQKAYRLLSTKSVHPCLHLIIHLVFPPYLLLPLSLLILILLPTQLHKILHSAPQDTSPAPQNTSPAPQPILPPPVPFAPRHSTRIRHPPAHLQDYVCTSVVTPTGECSRTLTSLCLSSTSDQTRLQLEMLRYHNVENGASNLRSLLKGNYRD